MEVSHLQDSLTKTKRPAHNIDVEFTQKTLYNVMWKGMGLQSSTYNMMTIRHTELHI